MIINKDCNPKGSYGRCSCRKLSDFTFGDKVVVVNSCMPGELGECGKVLKTDGLFVHVQFRKDSIPVPLWPQRLRKISA